MGYIAGDAAAAGVDTAMAYEQVERGKAQGKACIAVGDRTAAAAVAGGVVAGHKPDVAAVAADTHMAPVPAAAAAATHQESEAVARPVAERDVEPAVEELVAAMVPMSSAAVVAAVAKPAAEVYCP